MFQPRLEILPESQQHLWRELSAVPPEFTLYGGTALALRLGHRQSIDFDFFAREPIDPDQLLAKLPFLGDARTLQRDVNTLTCLVFRGGPVQISFFGLPRLGLIEAPETVTGPEIRIAGLLDLAGTKAAVIQKRAEAKDYIDIDALMTRGGLDLPQILAAGRAVYGRQFEQQITVKAMTYFEDGNLASLTSDLKNRMKKAAISVNLTALPSLTALEPAK